MPSPSHSAPSSGSINVYHAASDIPSKVIAEFEENPVSFNTIYPHFLKCAILERSGSSMKGQQVWIVVMSYDPKPTVDLVLSCTENEMGKYPIFIATSRPHSQLTSSFLEPRIRSLIEELRVDVNDRRVYSIFAPDPIAQCFARLWKAFTGIDSYREPYYAAKLTSCTSTTFRNPSPTVDSSLQFKLRPAVEGDEHAVARLCYGFASESDPFFLEQKGALLEASILIRNRTVWIHEVIRPNGEIETACLVAFTRNSDTMSTITKVYTNPNTRGMGCAQRLMRRVCEHLFESKTKVALYVAHNNPSASKVYHNVGFIGLDGDDGPTEGVEHWIEYGFDREKVDLGHW
ncbi:hypothetical protein VKT23_000440 [Stygiomarasmius scandens]|uniref:N-acetyltransferase domain-containing protein n=1 Tax=Marasmiellus scandens TaxID=2682957 RepID=A0ABR1KA21_9AGAR